MKFETKWKLINYLSKIDSLQQYMLSNLVCKWKKKKQMKFSANSCNKQKKLAIDHY